MEAKYLKLEQRSKEWFDWRNEPGFVSASEMDALMGFSSWCTPYQLWLYKTGREERPDLSNNPDVQRGVDLEDEALAMVYDKLGVDPEDDVGHCGEYGAVKVSLDGLYMDGDTDHHSLIPIEIKCPRQLSNQLYKKYFWQMCAQAYVYDAPFVVFAQYVDGEIFIEHVNITDADKELMLEHCNAFLFRIKDDTPPGLMKGDSYRLPTSSDIEELIKEYQTNSVYLKEVKERNDDIKAMLSGLITEKETDTGVSYDSYTLGDLRFTKTVSRRLDKDALYKHKGIDAADVEMFSSSASSMRVTIKK